MEDQKILAKEIYGYVNSAKGLELESPVDGSFTIRQKTDGKKITVDTWALESVLDRVDHLNNSFLQVNFVDGRKILVTDALIGFKPSKVVPVDLSKVPKVVTTPDLISVLEALEETLSSEYVDTADFRVLKRLYESILLGGEEIGFDLSTEKTWVYKLSSANNKASA